MRLITAEELMDELVRAIRPPQGNVITLREFKPKTETDTNWIPGTGQMPMDAIERYGKAVAKLRKQHPLIDWTGVEKFDGKVRHLARYRLEAKT